MSTMASTGSGGSTGGDMGSTGFTGSTGTGGGSTGYTGSTASSTGAQMGWGDIDWRTRMAAGNHDELKRLQRFESPDQVYDSYRALERRMSAGELKTALPKNATPEETARWRADNGIPAKPEDYKINLPAGQKAPAEDDQFIKAFFKDAHAQNMTQAQVDTTLAGFYREVDNQQAILRENEATLTQAAEDKLRVEWGADYRVNKNMAEALLSRAPAGLRDSFMNGYLADHSPIKASVEAWKWLAQMEREINPAATVVPGAGSDPGKTIAGELVDLRALMGNPNSEYWKGEKAEAMQARYRQLLEAENKLKAKAA